MVLAFFERRNGPCFGRSFASQKLNYNNNYYYYDHIYNFVHIIFFIIFHFSEQVYNHSVLIKKELKCYTMFMRLLKVNEIFDSLP